MEKSKEEKKGGNYGSEGRRKERIKVKKKVGER